MALVERARPVHLDFRGESTLPPGLPFDGTVVGGLSSITYDAERDLVLGSDMNTGLWILRVTA